MNPRLLHVLQLVSWAMLAWFAYSSLGRLHWLFPLAVVILASCNVATIWMLRHRPQVLTTACRQPLLLRYVRGVCYFSGDQPPMEHWSTDSTSEILLLSQREFQIAAYRAKQIVRGHDAVIDGVLGRIHENLTLCKSRRAGSGAGPLASFLLVGDEGVGKRYLTRVLAKLLYRNDRVEVFSRDRITLDRLVGTKATPGELLETVRRQPYQVLLFENIDAITAEMAMLLVQLLTFGRLRSPGSEKHVCFQNTTVFLSTTNGSDALALLADRQLGRAAWHQRAIETVSKETLIDDGLLNAVTDLFNCRSPTDQVKAEVAALLMQQECAAHDVELSHIDPEILATHAIQIAEINGFRLAPQRIKNLLRRPLVAATAGGHRRLSLRLRTDRLSHLEITQR